MTKPLLMMHHLQTSLMAVADPVNAVKQRAYLRDQFAFLGVPKPLQKQIGRAIFKEYPFCDEEEVCYLLQLLWQKEEREFQYMALELAHYYKKYRSEQMLAVFEMMIRTHSWWDTVDDIAANLVGSCVRVQPHLVSLMDAWIEDPCLWIRRSALLFQLKWKNETDEKRLFRYCQKTMHEKDFFMRKAIGWVLRQYSKTYPNRVAAFIEAYRHELSPLSIREGSKYLELE